MEQDPALNVRSLGSKAGKLEGAEEVPQSSQVFAQVKGKSASPQASFEQQSVPRINSGYSCAPKKAFLGRQQSIGSVQSKSPGIGTASPSTDPKVIVQEYSDTDDPGFTSISESDSNSKMASSAQLETAASVKELKVLPDSKNKLLTEQITSKEAVAASSAYQSENNGKTLPQANKDPKSDDISNYAEKKFKIRHLIDCFLDSQNIRQQLQQAKEEYLEQGGASAYYLLKDDDNSESYSDDICEDDENSQAGSVSLPLKDTPDASQNVNVSSDQMCHSDSITNSSPRTLGVADGGSANYSPKGQDAVDVGPALPAVPLTETVSTIQSKIDELVENAIHSSYREEQDDYEHNQTSVAGNGSVISKMDFLTKPDNASSSESVNKQPQKEINLENNRTLISSPNAQGNIIARAIATEKSNSSTTEYHDTPMPNSNPLLALADIANRQSRAGTSPSASQPLEAENQSKRDTNTNHLNYKPPDYMAHQPAPMPPPAMHPEQRVRAPIYRPPVEMRVQDYRGNVSPKQSHQQLHQSEQPQSQQPPPPVQPPGMIMGGPRIPYHPHAGYPQMPMGMMMPVGQRQRIMQPRVAMPPPASRMSAGIHPSSQSGRMPSGGQTMRMPTGAGQPMKTPPGGGQAMRMPLGGQPIRLPPGGGGSYPMRMPPPPPLIPLGNSQTAKASLGSGSISDRFPSPEPVRKSPDSLSPHSFGSFRMSPRIQNPLLTRMQATGQNYQTMKLRTVPMETSQNEPLNLKSSLGEGPLDLSVKKRKAPDENDSPSKGSEVPLDLSSKKARTEGDPTSPVIIPKSEPRSPSPCHTPSSLRGLPSMRTPPGHSPSPGASWPMVPGMSQGPRMVSPGIMSRPSSHNTPSPGHAPIGIRAPSPMGTPGVNPRLPHQPPPALLYQPSGATARQNPTPPAQGRENPSPQSAASGNNGNNPRMCVPAQMLIGNHSPKDILYMLCRMCGSTYGSVYGFRRHFRNQHGFEPSPDHVFIQSISQTKEYIHRQAAGEGLLSLSQAGPPQNQMPVPMTPPPLPPGEQIPQPVQAAQIPPRLPELQRLHSSTSPGSGSDSDKSAPPGDNVVLNCQDCGEDFPPQEWQHFKRHIRSHFGERKHKCTYCDYSTDYMHHLQDHINKHTNNRPHVCKICNIAYANAGTLSRHVRTAHAGEDGSRLHYCHLCGKSYRFFKDYKEHIEHHKQGLIPLQLKSSLPGSSSVSTPSPESGEGVPQHPHHGGPSSPDSDMASLNASDIQEKFKNDVLVILSEDEKSDSQSVDNHVNNNETDDVSQSSESSPKHVKTGDVIRKMVEMEVTKSVDNGQVENSGLPSVKHETNTDSVSTASRVNFARDADTKISRKLRATELIGQIITRELRKAEPESSSTSVLTSCDGQLKNEKVIQSVGESTFCRQEATEASDLVHNSSCLESTSLKVDPSPEDKVQIQEADNSNGNEVNTDKNRKHSNLDKLSKMIDTLEDKDNSPERKNNDSSVESPVKKDTRSQSKDKNKSDHFLASSPEFNQKTSASCSDIEGIGSAVDVNQHVVGSGRAENLGSVLSRPGDQELGDYRDSREFEVRKNECIAGLDKTQGLGSCSVNVDLEARDSVFVNTLSEKAAQCVSQKTTGFLTKDVNPKTPDYVEIKTSESRANAYHEHASLNKPVCQEGSRDTEILSETKNLSKSMPKGHSIEKQCDLPNKDFIESTLSSEIDPIEPPSSQQNVQNEYHTGSNKRIESDSKLQEESYFEMSWDIFPASDDKQQQKAQESDNLENYISSDSCNTSSLLADNSVESNLLTPEVHDEHQQVPSLAVSEVPQNNPPTLQENVASQKFNEQHQDVNDSDISTHIKKTEQKSNTVNRSCLMKNINDNQLNSFPTENDSPFMFNIESSSQDSHLQGPSSGEVEKCKAMDTKSSRRLRAAELIGQIITREFRKTETESNSTDVPTPCDGQLKREKVTVVDGSEKSVNLSDIQRQGSPVTNDSDFLIIKDVSEKMPAKPNGKEYCTESDYALETAKGITNLTGLKGYSESVKTEKIHDKGENMPDSDIILTESHISCENYENANISETPANRPVSQNPNKEKFTKNTEAEAALTEVEQVPTEVESNEDVAMDTEDRVHAGESHVVYTDRKCVQEIGECASDSCGLADAISKFSSLNRPALQAYSKLPSDKETQIHEEEKVDEKMADKTVKTETGGPRSASDVKTFLESETECDNSTNNDNLTLDSKGSTADVYCDENEVDPDIYIPKTANNDDVEICDKASISAIGSAMNSPPTAGQTSTAANITAHEVKEAMLDKNPKSPVNEPSIMDVNDAGLKEVPSIAVSSLAVANATQVQEAETTPDSCIVKGSEEGAFDGMPVANVTEHVKNTVIDSKLQIEKDSEHNYSLEPTACSTEIHGHLGVSRNVEQKVTNEQKSILSEESHELQEYHDTKYMMSNGCTNPSEMVYEDEKCDQQLIFSESQCTVAKKSKPLENASLQGGKRYPEENSETANHSNATKDFECKDLGQESVYHAFESETQDMSTTIGQPRSSVGIQSGYENASAIYCTEINEPESKTKLTEDADRPLDTETSAKLSTTVDVSDIGSVHSNLTPTSYDETHKFEESTELNMGEESEHFIALGSSAASSGGVEPSDFVNNYLKFQECLDTGIQNCETHAVKQLSQDTAVQSVESSSHSDVLQTCSDLTSTCQGDNITEQKREFQPCLSLKAKVDFKKETFS
ncbi:uncharacterized protein LOC106151449 [Lingula anatina]|uniref:Uncharacterized protein LOC106151449 n=1 Tax=Lingula anatina TaxID=7574 RepID=A0A1S3H3W3_LINAN|nr:uncharacterized protein LOC106151449 [Lingula anatina]XP_013380156.1 uncharacterized protein LOC106151449 [Lingula anatina]|eukprot:XP_013380155.1 uncharacterized protein LOC106151449 [Lingula anatina]